MVEQNVSERAIQIISKLSVKSIGCNPKKVAAMDDNPDGKPVTLPLCRIFGMVSGLKHGEDPRTNQVFTALTGEFGAVNLQDGNEFRSGKLFLPAGIQEVLEGPLTTAANDNPPREITIQFAFEISAVKAPNPIGYSYQARPLVKPAENDPLTALRAQIMGPVQPQLEAPKAPAAEPVRTGRGRK